MSQNPYEIRLSLLAMAKEMLEQEYFQESAAIDQQYGFQIEEATRKGLPIPERKLVAYPTQEAIIEKAKVLNDFVSNG